MRFSFDVGDWVVNLKDGEPCRLVAIDDVWGLASWLVWQPRRNEVFRLGHADLGELVQSPVIGPDEISYRAAAARVLDALEWDTLVAPLEATVIPLPHQLHALSRALSGDRVRYLLADEVGLGKTIEAGLILKEMKMRGLVTRTLVVAPAGLVTQWISEMRTHFNEDFRLVIPGSFAVWREITGADEADNLWRVHNQVVCPVDSVKPMEGRKGS